MRLQPDQLAANLKQGIKPVYLIYGDEALLLEESADLVRQAVRHAGANDREVWHVEGRFDWSQIKWQEQTLSLFASQRLVEIRLPSGSPGKDGGEVLRQFSDAPPADTTLIIISGKIDARSQKSKWFTQLDKLGATVPVWPIDAMQLPNWLFQRMQRQGLKADKRLAGLIAERVEGNLFAAAQELDKLALLSLDSEIDEATIMQSVADNARFEAFGLMDTVFLGQSHKIPRIINRLRTEGVEVMSVFSAISWSLHRLIDMSIQLQNGTAMERVFAAQKPPVWDKNKPVLRAALQRYNSMQWQQFLIQLSQIDQAAKGAHLQSPWQLLEQLCLQVSGVELGRSQWNKGVQH